MVAYVGTVSIMHIINKFDVFGDDIQFWRFIMGSIGITLIIILYIKIYVWKEKIACGTKKHRNACGI